jgi:hypothetical protein
MKKLLLGTTVLFGAAALATSAQAAPSVSVGGFIDFQAGATDQDAAFETGATARAGDSREFKFQNDTEIHVSVTGVSDTGLTYGANIELEADVTGDADNEGLNADKTYIFVESDEMGRVELGNNTDAAAALKVDASSIAVATGGIDGDFYDFANVAGFQVTPDLPTAAAAGATEDATKITYFTPKFSGFQGGVSFTPDQGDSGSAAGFTGENGSDFENVFNIGVNYNGTYNDGIEVDASLTGEFGDSESNATEDLSAWAAGVSVKMQAWTVAASYADASESGLTVGTANDDQSFWTLGAAYETGPYGVSLTYLDSESQDNEFNNIVVGADYKLAPGLVPYVEVSFFDTDDNTAGTADNDGSVVLVGAELSF